MLRLTVSYHADTREPVAVENGIHTNLVAWSYAVPMRDLEGRNLDTALAVGPDGEACRDLLLRERNHWRERCKL